MELKERPSVSSSSSNALIGSAQDRVGEVEEDTDVEDTVDLAEGAGQGPRIGDRAEGAVQDGVAVVGAIRFAVADPLGCLCRGELPGDLPADPGQRERHDFNRGWELAELLDDLRVVDDHDEAAGGDRDGFFPEKRAAAALGEGPVGSNLVRPVDGDIDVAAHEGDDGHPELAAQLLGRGRGDDRLELVAGGDALARPLDRPVGGRPGPQAHAHAAFHVPVDRRIPDESLGRFLKVGQFGASGTGKFVRKSNLCG